MMISYQKTNKAIGELQNTNLWEMHFDFAGSGVKFSEDVKFRCSSTTTPELEQNMKTATIHRFEISQPGSQKRWGEIELTFLESEDGQTSWNLEQLARAVYSQTENDVDGKSLGWENVKCTVILYTINSRGQRGHGFKLMDCSFTPKHWGGAEFASEDGIIQPKLTIHYNWFAYLKK